MPKTTKYLLGLRKKQKKTIKQTQLIGRPWCVEQSHLARCLSIYGKFMVKLKHFQTDDRTDLNTRSTFKPSQLTLALASLGWPQISPLCWCVFPGFQRRNPLTSQDPLKFKVGRRRLNA